MRENAEFDEYLQDFAEYIGSQDGTKLAILISLNLDISKFISPIKDIDNYIENRLEEPWCTICCLHCAVSKESDLKLKSDLQNQLVQNIHAIFAEQEKWFLPVVCAVNKDLLKLSRLVCKVDNSALEEAARTMNKAFSLCITDRYSNLSESRKWGVYSIVNILFKTYFLLSSTNLCSTILRSLGSADIPALEDYPKSEQITFKYYVGVLQFYDEKFDSAADYLMYSFQHSILKIKPKLGRGNRIFILHYLIPAKLILGVVPSDRLFKNYPSLKIYQSLVKAIKVGNLALFDKTIESNQSTLIKWGSWLVIDRARILVARQLFRSIWVIMGMPLRMSIPLFQKGISVSMGKVIAVEHVTCLLVNCIDMGYLKGYISHEKQVIVLSGKGPFPQIAPEF